jgi:protocatechuate 3,4-dioxygenase, beta subunit
MKKLFFIFLFILYFIGNSVLAYEKVDMFNPKRSTPQAIIIDNISKPEFFGKSNNLTRKPGSFKVAVGEPLYIEGVISDAFGVPIENAIVRIWQTNAAGKYQDLLPEESEYIDDNFIMSGQAITDNLGHYGFITIFPGFYKNRAPHINMIINSHRFGEIETIVYFRGHPKNEIDFHYLSYSAEDRALITANMRYVNPQNHKEGKIARFNITMDGVHQYKGF